MLEGVHKHIKCQYSGHEFAGNRSFLNAYNGTKWHVTAATYKRCITQEVTLNT